MSTQTDSGLLDFSNGRAPYERSRHGPPIVWIHTRTPTVVLLGDRDESTMGVIA